MNMLEITKINNGLSWGGVDRFFTNTSLESGYERLDDYHIHSELNNQIICFDCRQVIIDNEFTFNTSDEIISFLYGGL